MAFDKVAKKLKELATDELLGFILDFVIITVETGGDFRAAFCAALEEADLIRYGINDFGSRVNNVAEFFGHDEEVIPTTYEICGEDKRVEKDSSGVSLRRQPNNETICKLESLLEKVNKELAITQKEYDRLDQTMESSLSPSEKLAYLGDVTARLVDLRDKRASIVSALQGTPHCSTESSTHITQIVNNNHEKRVETTKPKCPVTLGKYPILPGVNVVFLTMIAGGGSNETTGGDKNIGGQNGCAIFNEPIFIHPLVAWLELRLGTGARHYGGFDGAVSSASDLQVRLLDRHHNVLSTLVVPGGMPGATAPSEFNQTTCTSTNIITGPAYDTGNDSHTAWGNRWVGAAVKRVATNTIPGDAGFWPRGTDVAKTVGEAAIFASASGYFALSKDRKKQPVKAIPGRHPYYYKNEALEQKLRARSDANVGQGGASTNFPENEAVNLGGIWFFEYSFARFME